jgi:hypothetical protein
MRNLDSLSQHTVLFPDPHQMIARGSKLYTLQTLVELANTATRTGYPEVVIIDDIADLNMWKNENLVFKRGYSDGGHDVGRGKGKPDMAIPRKRANDTAEHYDHPSLREYGVKPTWFAVPFIPELCEKGEIRCFFIGGRLSYLISTTPLHGHEMGDISIREVMEITPLTHLSYVPTHLCSHV